MKRTTVIFFCLLLGQLSLAQRSASDADPRRTWDQAVSWFQEGKLALAYPVFLRWKYENGSALHRIVPDEEVDFFRLACGVRLDELAAVEEATLYVKRTHPPAFVQPLSYYLADHHFRGQRYPAAQRYVESIDGRSLPTDDRIHRQFILGYSNFVAQRFDRALPCFDSIRSKVDHPDYFASNYYYGFLCLRRQQYEEALSSLKLVEDHPEYRSIVPYYIGQLYYLQGKKEEAISYVERKLQDPASQYYELPLKQLLGHAYFEKRLFEKALPLLKEYVGRAEKVRREDVYELSYCYHQSGQYDACIPGFRELSGGQDSLSQHAMYLLGDAYLKTGDLNSARSAFQFCARNNSYRNQREVSLLQYAKLSYELGYFKEAQSSLEQFFADYPTSVSKEEAEELMVMALSATNNFRQALQWLDRIKQPSNTVKKIFPRIWYGRAVELINDGLLDRAQVLLDQVMQGDAGGTWKQLAKFWSGEIAYRQQEYPFAIAYLQDYLSAPAIADGEATVQHARYTLGYAHIKRSNFTAAGEQFQSITKNFPNQPSTLLQDAWLRAGDCFYMTRDYSRARSYYDRAVLLGWPTADYAQFQLAMIAGIRSTTDKIRLLQQVIDKFPRSTLLPDSYLEIANSLIADRKFREAIPALDKVIATAPQDRWISRALLMQGVCFYNVDAYDESLLRLKEVVSRFPNSEDADDALENIRQVYVEMGKPADFVTYMQGIGKPLAYPVADSLSFAAGDRAYTSGQDAEALTALQNYLRDYPGGQYRLKAFYQCADITIRRRDWASARMNIDSVLARRPNKYEEESWRQGARIAYFEQKDISAALRYYTGLYAVASKQEWRVEALRGTVRCLHQLKDWIKGAEQARLLLNERDATSDDKAIAYTLIAQQALSQRQWDVALESFRSVVPANKGSLSAEARYQIASILFQQGKILEAERAAEEAIRRSGSFEPWSTKSYILIGDIYLHQKDYFNAKATYQSVIENAEDPLLQVEAKEKLQRVLEAERTSTKVDS